MTLPTSEQSSREQDAKVTAAMVEAALAAFNAFPCKLNQSIARSSNRPQMKATLKAALALSTPSALPAQTVGEKDGMRESLAALLESYERDQYRSWEKGSPDWHKSVAKARAAIAAPMPQAEPTPILYSTGELTAEQKNALKEAGWRAAIEVHSRHGMAGWSSHKESALSAPQEASKTVPLDEWVRTRNAEETVRDSIERFGVPSKEASKVEPVAGWMYERADEIVKRIHARVGTWGEQRKAIIDAMQEAAHPSPQALSDSGIEAALDAWFTEGSFESRMRKAIQAAIGGKSNG